jgi:hypothetical protein
MGTMSGRPVLRFEFSKGRLLAVVVGLALIGVGLVTLRPSGNTMMHALSGSIAGTIIIYALSVVLLAAALFHLPNLVKSLLGRPAIEIDDENLLSHQFPSRIVPLRDIRNVELVLGSLRLTLRSGAEKWINLKIVRDAQECVDALGARIAAGADGA